MPPKLVECGRLIHGVQGQPRARHCHRLSRRADPMPAHSPAAFLERIHRTDLAARCAQSRARAGRLCGRRFGETGGADSQRARKALREPQALLEFRTPNFNWGGVPCLPTTVFLTKWTLPSGHQH